MAAVAKIFVSPLDYLHRTGQSPALRPVTCRIPAESRRGLWIQPCRSFRSEDGGDVAENERESSRKNVNLKEISSVESKRGIYRTLDVIKSAFVRSSSQSDEIFSEKLEESLSSIALQIGRYIVTMMSTGVILLTGFQLSGGESQMNGLIWYSWLGGIIIGTMIGSNMVLEEVSRAGPRNVVITGSTRGLGKALAREFLLNGDRVVVASRSQESVDMTIRELEESLNEAMTHGGSSFNKNLIHAKVVGISCDVCQPQDVSQLANFAVNQLGSIDIWINNAGTNKGFRPLLQFSDEDIQQIVSTNLVGSILCTREAMRVMISQNKGGHIFNMDGNGSGGSSTPLTAVYGSTKCGLRQLQSSLLKECKKSNVGMHTASPGMVLTDLLLSGSSIQNKQMFNIICEHPETVARTLVPRMRVVKGSGKAINYLTPPRILLALVTAWLRRGRWFDDKFTLNTDGSRCGDRDIAGIGCIVRDREGNFVSALAKNVGKATINTAELWAIKEGLCMAISKGIKYLEIQTDSQVICNILNMKVAEKMIHQSILREILEMVKEFDGVCVKFVYREANKCADYLAKYGMDNKFVNILFNSPPFELSRILDDDMVRRSQPRLLNSLCNILFMI